MNRLISIFVDGGGDHLGIEIVHKVFDSFSAFCCEKKFEEQVKTPGKIGGGKTRKNV